jgi:phosphoribosylaminoimidazolecarboxamide formyltransferase/IMP cyclohydrolase
VTEVGAYTGFPEMMEGRVKTLHPKVHGGILARRDKPDHVRSMKEHGIPPIDMVVVNLYPFAQTVAKPAARWKTGSRTSTSAGRRWCARRQRTMRSWPVVTDPSDYRAAARGR